MPARPDAVATACRNADPLFRLTQAHTRAYADEKRGLLTAGTSCTIYLFIYLFFLVQSPLRSGEQARTRTICGASIRFLFLPWWGQIDRKTHAGGVVVVVVVHMTISYLPRAFRFPGSWQGRKRHLSFHATGREGVETFSTTATASNNNYALIRAWWGGGRAYTGTSKRSSRTKRANTQKARNLQGCNCRSCRLGWANLALLLVLISCI